MQRQPTRTQVSTSPARARLAGGFAIPLACAAALLALLAAAWPSAALAAAPWQQEVTIATPSVWPMVLAMLAAAFGIERVLELMWNFAEWIALSSKRWRPAALKTAAYLQFKSGVSVLLGAILGVLLAGIMNLHFFAALAQLAPGFTVNIPANWDVVVTGLIIGVAAKPIHDLIELLAELKNFMSNAAVRQREAAGAAMAEGVLKLAQSEAESMIEVPGLGRTPLAGDAYTRPGEGSPTPDQSPTEKYIEVLHTRTLT